MENSSNRQFYNFGSCHRPISGKLSQNRANSPNMDEFSKNRSSSCPGNLKFRRIFRMSFPAFANKALIIRVNVGIFTSSSGSHSFHAITGEFSFTLGWIELKDWARFATEPRILLDANIFQFKPKKNPKSKKWIFSENYSEIIKAGDHH